MITIKTSDNQLHFYPNNTLNEVIEFLQGKGMTRVYKMPSNNSEFQIV